MPRKAHPRPLRPPTNATMPQGASHAILNNCHNFTINGGTFMNTNDPDESDFPNIKLGHLKLVKEVAKQNIVEYHEVRHKRTGVVKCRVPRIVGLREIYQVRIHGSQDEFTAVVYQGSDFEKHRVRAEQRENFRHPSLVQLFGVTSGNFNALIYHDGLIPLDEFRKMHQQSPLVSAFLEKEMFKHLIAALTHWMGITGEWLVVWDSYGLWKQLEMGTVLWIHISTGQLCIEVNDNEEPDPTPIPLGLPGASLPFRVHLTSDTNLEERVLSHMSLDNIHGLLSAIDPGYLIDIADPGTVRLGSLSWPTSSYALFNPFSGIPLSDGLGLLDVHSESWENRYTQSGSSSLNENLFLLPNGWTRVGLKDLPIHEECHFRKNIYKTLEAQGEIRKCWLSQANHVMDKSGLDADECFIIDRIGLHFSLYFDTDGFTLQGTFMASTPTEDLYLFLFPTNIGNSGGHLVIHLPPESETYYWSFDPDGVERLPQDALEELALPHIYFWAQVGGVRWNQEVYDCITKIHCAKGFNPTSQDVAIELGYPLVDIDRLINLIYCDAIEVADEGELQEA